ncbi:MAG: hypothetical protein OJF52_001671 [Nitrospira sp.]|jgi:hypothetical protein|nr:MAG: hypothetical protein OJF52_001671 [Nitrospira sp.]
MESRGGRKNGTPDRLLVGAQWVRDAAHSV